MASIADASACFCFLANAVGFEVPALLRAGTGLWGLFAKAMASAASLTLQKYSTSSFTSATASSPSRVTCRFTMRLLATSTAVPECECTYCTWHETVDSVEPSTPCCVSAVIVGSRTEIRMSTRFFMDFW